MFNPAEQAAGVVNRKVRNAFGLRPGSVRPGDILKRWYLLEFFLLDRLFLGLHWRRYHASIGLREVGVQWMP